MKENKLETITNLFENSTIRSVWNSEKEEYYFSVVDVINALANPKDARKYWSVLKSRLKKEGSEVTTNCSQLKMLAPDGKMRLRDAMKTNDILRLIESIPSPKAEPFKLWLANLGEIATRELAKEHKPYGLEQNKKIAKRGGNIARITRDNLEKELGRTVIINKNVLNYECIDNVKVIEDKQ